MMRLIIWVCKIKYRIFNSSMYIIVCLPQYISQSTVKSELLRSVFDHRKKAKKSLMWGFINKFFRHIVFYYTYIIQY